MSYKKNEKTKNLGVNNLPRNKKVRQPKEYYRQLKEFFDQWLRSGDLKRVAGKLEKSYVVVRQTRLTPEKSRKISDALYEVCLSNKLRFESNLDIKTIDLIMRIDDKEVRLGLWNRLTGGQ